MGLWGRVWTVRWSDFLHSVIRAPTDLALLRAHFLEAILRSFINLTSVPRKAVKSESPNPYVWVTMNMRSLY